MKLKNHNFKLDSATISMNYQNMVSLIKKNKSYIYNNFISYVVIIINVVILVFSTRFLIQKLGKDDYGTWLFLLNILGYLLLIHFGYSSTFISKFHLFQKTFKDQNKFFTIFCCVGLFLGLLGCLIGFFVSVHLDAFFQSKDGFYQAQKALLYCLPGFLFGFFGLFLESILVVYYKMLNYKSVLDFVRGGGLGVLYCTWIYFYGVDIAYLGLIYSIVVGLIFISNCIFFVKHAKFVWDFDSKYLIYLFNYLPGSFMYWLLSISSIFLAQADYFYIGYFLKDMSLVAVYSQSFRLSEVLSRFIKKITDNKVPQIMDLYKNGDEIGLRKLIHKILLLTFCVSASSALLISIFGTNILNLWLGKYIEFDFKLILVFALILVVNSIYYVFWNLMSLIERQKSMALVGTFEITVNVVLSILLVFKFQLVGLALASLIANTISLTVVLFQFKNRSLIQHHNLFLNE